MSSFHSPLTRVESGLPVGQEGQPTLFGPFLVEHTDIPHNGNTIDLWTPAVGDVLLRLFTDKVAATNGDLAGSLQVGTAGEPALLSGADISPDAGNIVTAPHVFTDTTPVRVTQDAGGDASSGHVEFYAVVARAVAP